MAEFVNAKTPNPAEENDTELNIDVLDGVSGGVGNQPSDTEKDMGRPPMLVIDPVPEPDIAPASADNSAMKGNTDEMRLRR